MKALRVGGLHSREDRYGEWNIPSGPLAKACSCNWEDNDCVRNLYIPEAIEVNLFSLS